MMDLGFLMVPFFTGLAAFSLAVFNNVEAVNIEAISVPAAITAKTGYTAGIVIKRLADRMHDIEQEAHTRADAKEVMAQDDGGSAQVLGDYFGLSPMLRVVQTSFGLIPYTLSGEIVQDGGNLVMVLRGSDNHTKHSTLIRQTVTGDDLPGLINLTAYEAVRMIDPSLLAAYQFKKDFLTRDFTKTESIIHRALASDDDRSHKWMLNLWGIVLYQQADRDGAIDKFRRALEIDPNFASSLLNWGVVLARQGKHQDAMEKFAQVVARWKKDDPVQTLAAAYTEWGFSLALLGRTDKSYAWFKKAAEVDPTFSDVYTTWAEVLSANGQPDQAHAMTARAIALTPVEKLYTDNLVGRIQHLPAMAASN